MGSVSVQSIAHLVVAVPLVVAGGLTAVVGLYLLALAVAALFHKTDDLEGNPPPPATRHVAILVPAHNEADFIADCVESLVTQSYPRHLYEVVVVADNCTDGTANIAASAGARVLIRDEDGDRGKGQALRWAMDQLLAQAPSPDAILVVDADATADEDFLRRMARPLEHGALAAQGESLLSEPVSARAALRAAAFLLINRVRPAGRAVLHLPCNLAGNGMLLSRELLGAHPWSAFSSAEDLEYSITVRLHGVRPVFVGGAILRSPAITSRVGAERQQLRWEGGKLSVARAHLRSLVATGVRRRSITLLDAAIDLAVPPLGLLAATATAGSGAAAALVRGGFIGGVALVPWLVALVSVPAFVLVGFRAARAPGWAYLAMIRAPLFVAAKVFQVHRVLRFRADTWVRGQRPSDAGPTVAEPIGPA